MSEKKSLNQIEVFFKNDNSSSAYLISFGENEIA